jgi:hypothetical protein
VSVSPKKRQRKKKTVHSFHPIPKKIRGKTLIEVFAEEKKIMTKKELTEDEKADNALMGFDEPDTNDASDEKRSFQTSPTTHEMLTRAQARKKGFFWSDVK